MRKPSWIDLLALAAVVVVAWAIIRYYQTDLHPRSSDFVPAENAFLDGARKVRFFLDRVTPACFGLAVVGLVRVFRESRPRRRLMFRQPGVAACAAFAAALAAGAVNMAVWTVRWLEFSEAWLTPGEGMVIALALRQLPYCILAAWAFLAFGGLWTHGRNWVNWLGCAIGIVAIVDLIVEWLP